MKESYREQLERLFPNTAHGFTGRDFADRYQGMAAMFASDGPASNMLRGWPGKMDFSGALLALKTGQHLARASWGDRHAGGHGGPCHGRYVALQIGYPGGVQLNGNTAQATGMPEGSIGAFKPYLIMCLPGAQSQIHGVKYPAGAPVFVPWSAGADDLLAEDWQIVCRPDDPPTDPGEDVTAFGVNQPTRGPL